MLQADPKVLWQMALLGHGMQVRAGVGVGWMQFRVVTTPDSFYVMTGLVPVGASVGYCKHPGSPGTPGVGWYGDGDVDWTLPGPAPASKTVRFGQGDRVMVVLDCRQGPLVRLLVNGQPRLVHHLAPPEGGPIAVLCPAIALHGAEIGGDGGDVRVEVEAGAPLPDDWESAAPS